MQKFIEIGLHLTEILRYDDFQDETA